MVKAYDKWYDDLRCECYLCGWVGTYEERIVVDNVKGPMFGQSTTGYKCPRCQQIFMWDGESCPNPLSLPKKEENKMEEKMEQRDTNAYYVGTSQYSFRSGELAVILGVETYYLADKIRPCFKVQYADGKTDYCPVEDLDNYKIIPASEVRLKYGLT
jgi:hypothetical protein